MVAQGREAIFDAEHFFDGHEIDAPYAAACLGAALDAGARWLVLCDTNGGTMPARIGAVVAELIAGSPERAGIPGERLGIHTHDDTGQAVAGSLAAVEAGARQIQGTLGGLGERCGNADLVTLIPTLMLKEPFASRFATGVTPDALASLTRVSRTLDDILNRVPRRAAPYVGASAFAHKAGLHASAILKDPATYEHVPPESVGNARVVPMSNQAGRSNLVRRLAEAGLAVARDDPALPRILEVVKAREAEGYAYDTAQASFELVARAELGRLATPFEVERYRVTVERRRNAKGRVVSHSEAVVAVRIGETRMMSASESVDAEGSDAGPVNALAQALVKDLGPLQAAIADMRLVDFKVRITDGGTEAVTRVIIDSADAGGRRWSTVGVSANIIDASFEALIDAITWKLIRDGAGKAGALGAGSAPEPPAMDAPTTALAAAGRGGGVRDARGRGGRLGRRGGRPEDEGRGGRRLAPGARRRGGGGIARAAAWGRIGGEGAFAASGAGSLVRSRAASVSGPLGRRPVS